jgi:hypothetical protein
VNPFYFIGIGCMAIGAGFIYAAGQMDGRKDTEAELWADANHSKVGPVDDVRRIRDRFDTASDST